MHLLEIIPVPGCITQQHFIKAKPSLNPKGFLDFIRAG